MQREMEQFLARGGAVNEIPRGQSAIEPGKVLPSPNSFPQNAAKQNRESLLHVTRALDERRRSLRGKSPASIKANKSPAKVPVYDDFGEVVRWEWRAS